MSATTTNNTKTTTIASQKQQSLVTETNDSLPKMTLIDLVPLLVLNKTGNKSAPSPVSRPPCFLYPSMMSREMPFPQDSAGRRAFLVSAIDDVLNLLDLEDDEDLFA